MRGGRVAVVVVQGGEAGRKVGDDFGLVEAGRVIGLHLDRGRAVDQLYRRLLAQILLGNRIDHRLDGHVVGKGEVEIRIRDADGDDLVLAGGGDVADRVAGNDIEDELGAGRDDGHVADLQVIGHARLDGDRVLGADGRVVGERGRENVVARHAPGVHGDGNQAVAGRGGLAQDLPGAGRARGDGPGHQLLGHRSRGRVEHLDLQGQRFSHGHRGRVERRVSVVVEQGQVGPLGERHAGKRAVAVLTQRVGQPHFEQEIGRFSVVHGRQKREVDDGLGRGGEHDFRRTGRGVEHRDRHSTVPAVVGRLRKGKGDRNRGVEEAVGRGVDTHQRGVGPEIGHHVQGHGLAGLLAQAVGDGDGEGFGHRLGQALGARVGDLEGHGGVDHPRRISLLLLGSVPVDGDSLDADVIDHPGRDVEGALLADLSRSGDREHQRQLVAGSGEGGERIDGKLVAGPVAHVHGIGVDLALLGRRLVIAELAVVETHGHGLPVADEACHLHAALQIAYIYYHGKGLALDRMVVPQLVLDPQSGRLGHGLVQLPVQVDGGRVVRVAIDVDGARVEAQPASDRDIPIQLEHGARPGAQQIALLVAGRVVAVVELHLLDRLVALHDVGQQAHRVGAPLSGHGQGDLQERVVGKALALQDGAAHHGLGDLAPDRFDRALHREGLAIGQVSRHGQRGLVRGRAAYRDELAVHVAAHGVDALEVGERKRHEIALREALRHGGGSQRGRGGHQREGKLVQAQAIGPVAQKQAVVAGGQRGDGMRRGEQRERELLPGVGRGQAQHLGPGRHPERAGRYGQGLRVGGQGQGVALQGAQVDAVKQVAERVVEEVAVRGHDVHRAGGGDDHLVAYHRGRGKGQAVVVDAVDGAVVRAGQQGLARMGEGQHVEGLIDLDLARDRWIVDAGQVEAGAGRGGQHGRGGDQGAEVGAAQGDGLASLRVERHHPGEVGLQEIAGIPPNGHAVGGHGVRSRIDGFHVIAGLGTAERDSAVVLGRGHRYLAVSGKGHPDDVSSRYLGLVALCDLSGGSLQSQHRALLAAQPDATARDKGARYVLYGKRREAAGERRVRGQAHVHHLQQAVRGERQQLALQRKKPVGRKLHGHAPLDEVGVEHDQLAVGRGRVDVPAALGQGRESALGEQGDGKARVDRIQRAIGQHQEAAGPGLHVDERAPEAQSRALGEDVAGDGEADQLPVDLGQQAVVRDRQAMAQGGGERRGADHGIAVVRVDDDQADILERYKQPAGLVVERRDLGVQDGSQGVRSL